MFSMTTRLLIAGSIILSAFLGLTGYALDHTYQRSAREAAEVRLLGHVMTLIAVAPVKLDGTIYIPKSLPLADFGRLNSGLYGKIIDEDGEIVWSSASLGNDDFPTTQHPHILDSDFSTIRNSQGSKLFRLSYGVSWDSINNTHIYTINVAAPTDAFEQDIIRFRQLLWLWLGGVSIVLLATQGVILRWSLNPLRLAAEEIGQIEQGRQTEINGEYPKELRSLTKNLNALIHTNREHLIRHRHGLSDLAHSLKTPLALMQSVSENNASEAALKTTVFEQVSLMQQIVDYQLQRAATTGRVPLSKPIQVNNIALKILKSLSKVYVDKYVKFDTCMDNNCLFYGDESDLYELLGNLLDNAFKWSHKQVRISIQRSDDQFKSLLIKVEDDGPGVDKTIATRIVERGVYSPAKQGTGIGLAIVKDIAEIYDGNLSIGRSPMGGACFSLVLKQFPEID